MGVRSKQLNLDELYSELDPRYGQPAKSLELNVTTTWNLQGEYYIQTIENLENVKTDSKLIVQPKFYIEKTYEENLAIENLFAHIVKIISNDKSVTLYSDVALDKAFDIQVLYF